MPRSGRSGWLLLVTLLVGCTTTSRDSGPDANWYMNGRLAIVSETRRGAFGLNWAQFDRDYIIDLYGPLGVGIGRVERTGSLVTLKLPGEPDVMARNADELLYRVTGLAIPVTPMRYWVRGEPAPGLRLERLPSGFRQGGWLIEYQRLENGLPMRMTMTRSEARMTLSVRSWDSA